MKRNHHYVWSYYLKSWADGNDISYISKKGKISRDSVKGLAKETDFYKIHPLSEDDVALIRRFSKLSPPFLQEEHESQLELFLMLSHISASITSSGSDSKELKLIDAIIKNNSLENMHSIYEALSVDVLEALSKGRSDILNDPQNMIAFCSYLGHQMSRTKSFRQNLIEASSGNALLREKFSNEANLLKRNWWFISYMFGLNIGFGLYESKDQNRHIYIVNETDVPFITSDNPIINVHPSVLGIRRGSVPPEVCDFYFPVSPKYAYMINQSSVYNNLENGIDSDMVNKLNGAIYQKSYENVFASGNKVLEDVKAYNKGV